MTLEVSVEFCHAWRRQCRITCLLLLNFSSNKLSGNNLLDNIYVLFTGFRQRCQVQAARHTCCWGWRDDRWARWNLRVSKLEFKFFVWKVKFLSLSLDFIDFSYLNCLVFSVTEKSNNDASGATAKVTLTDENDKPVSPLQVELYTLLDSSK